MLNEDGVETRSEPITLTYEADLLGNIQQALAGLQGFGVMALELIQNADDAGAASLSFDVTDGGLFVRNSGEFSTCGLREMRCPWERNGDSNGRMRACNFHAISRMGSRNKIRVSSQIGRFGIGFVSVYQVTDAPIVRSSGVEMQLIPIDGSGATKVIPPGDGTEFELPWAAVASDTRAALNASPTPPEVVSLLVEAIAEVMARGLFFLRHIRSVELFRNGALVHSVSISREDGIVELAIGMERRSEKWKLLTRDASDLAGERKIYEDFPTLAELDRSPVVNIAVPLHEDPIEGLLYAYLPTEQPSGLPLHINADFFPHPTRRTITLTGEQHERYWNELLLDVAARALAESFDELRELIGPRRTWALAAGAFAMKDRSSFKSFWLDLQVAAKTSRGVLTVDDGLAFPGECHLPEQLPTEGQAALAAIGMRLLHADLRPHWSMFQALGASPLRLPALVSALESADFPEHLDGLRPLWAAVDGILTQSKARQDFAALTGRLKAVSFVLDLEGASSAIDELYRPAVGVSSQAIRRFVPGAPLVHAGLLEFEALAGLLDVYRFDDFARDFAAAVPDEEAAIELIGPGEDGARQLYDLLPAFLGDGVTVQAGARLANVPMLRTRSGFVEPSRGQLPGGFTDPAGHFELVDIELMSEAMRAFAKDILRVDVLTFQAYVEDHLEEILKREPSREQYVTLLTEILNHRAELDSNGALRSLADRAFVRTRAGSYVRPSECYYWSAPIANLLGDDGRFFVDESWMPVGQAAARFQDILENALGTRRSVSIDHLVARIEAIASTKSIDEIAERTQPIVRHILDRFARLTSNELSALERLRTLNWLPGSIAGARVQATRFGPAVLYRSFRAAGYASQVKVVDLPILRGGGQAPRSLVDFLDFLRMESEPPTEAVVAHLEHCMANQAPASDVVYAILSERLNGPDSACIERLRGKAFIYDPELAGYLRADQIFWEPTYFRGYWYAPSPRMRLREELFRHLGVEDAPKARNYVTLLKRIGSREAVAEVDVEVHRRCLAWLANALERGDEETQAELRAARGERVLLNLLDVATWPDDAAWLDSRILAEPFGGALDERLVVPPTASRVAVIRLFRELGVARLSEIARLALADVPEGRPALDATERLQARADLLLWLAPNEEFHDALRAILARAEIRLVERLRVLVEIVEYDPPVHSPVVEADAFYDHEGAILYVCERTGSSFDWSAAFKALFAPLEQLSLDVDMPPVIMTAAYVATMLSREDAERALRAANYHPPEGRYEDLPETEELRDTQDDEDATLLVEEDVGDAAPQGHDAGDGEEPDDALAPEADEVQPDEANEASAERAGENGSSERSGGTQARTGGGDGDGAGDAPFASKTDGGRFGAEAGTAGSSVETGPFHGAGGGWKPNRSERPAPSRSERQQRRSRLLSYVNAASREGPAAESGALGEDIGPLIDDAAIEAALKYERRFGREPVEQPHNNPGYDIVSSAADGSPRRLIEVKGLEGEWTERGIKLSHVQFATAQKYPGEYWLYVVEFARDLRNQRVSAIANPFSKVIEYWFDHGWKGVVEEAVAAADLNLAPGVRVRHAVWGVGTIEQVNRRGIAISLLVDFGFEGRKLIPFNSSLDFVD